MKSARKGEIVAGGLFIIATLTFMVGNGLISSTIDNGNYLGVAYPNKTLLIIGLLLELVNSMAIVGISIALFPSLRHHNEEIALGYIGFRIIEAVILIAGMLFVTLLISLSQDFISLGGNDNDYLQAIGNLLTQGYATAFQIAMLVLGLYSLILCYFLYKKRLTPRYLATLGLIGYASLMISALAEILGYSMGMWLYLPGAVFEIIFPIRLIVKGLDHPVIAPAHAVGGVAPLKQFSH